MIPFFGFLLDWAITRFWQRMLLLFALPLSLTLFVAITSILGSIMDQELLAEKYLNVGELELGALENDWAYEQIDVEKGLSNDDSAKEKQQIGRFTEALFKRAQQLDHENFRTRFVIGAILARQGATSAASSVMTGLAPDDREGYAPAHAWLAMYWDNIKRQRPLNEAEMQVFRHHMQYAEKSKNSPAEVSLASARLALQDNRGEQSLEALTNASEKQPEFEGELLRVAIQLKNVLVAEQAARKIENRLTESSRNGKMTAKDRIDLADALFYLKKNDEVEKLLAEGLAQKWQAPSELQKLARAQSEFYRLKFVASKQQAVDGFSVDVGYLDMAMRADPSNPAVAEEVAQLAAMGGKPTEQLINQLNEFLAKGIATPITHDWIAKVYAIRNDYAKAIEHWTNVVTRIPNYAYAHNNLAFAIAERYPERLDEAYEHAKIANNLIQNDADFRDTMALIYLKQSKLREALAEAESAIELQPNRIDLHRRAAEICNKLGDKVYEAAQLKVIKELEDASRKSEIEAPAAK
jgi:tetratricopeptide (TPR) repeat protein